MTTISVITPTFNREDALARCVQSVLGQQVDAAIEHLVVNDYGQPLQPADWMNDPRVRVLNTFRTERSVARNTGAALSRGDWLYFLDDDDYALPGAFAALLEVAERTQAGHVFGGYRVVNCKTGAEVVHQPGLQGDILPMLIAGEGIPPQASWFRRDAFFHIGGFDPLSVPAEDADLVRRMGLCEPIASTQFIVAVALFSQQTTTTNYNAHHEVWLQGAEKALSMPQTLNRLLGRTGDNPYWRGRCARIYLGSALRNLRQKQYGLAFSRFCGALCLLRTSRPQMREIWRGMLRRQAVPLTVSA